MSDTKMIRHAKSLVKRYMKEKQIYTKYNIMHVAPRCFVVGRSGNILLVSRSYLDFNEHLQQHIKNTPTEIVRSFDKRLQMGDWCITAYISTNTSGETWAIKLED